MKEKTLTQKNKRKQTTPPTHHADRVSKEIIDKVIEECVQEEKIQKEDEVKHEKKILETRLELNCADAVQMKLLQDLLFAAEETNKHLLELQEKAEFKFRGLDEHAQELKHMQENIITWHKSEMRKMGRERDEAHREAHEVKFFGKSRGNRLKKNYRKEHCGCLERIELN